MPRAIQLINGFATVAAAGIATVTPAPGDTFTVPSFALTDSASLEQVWLNGASVDFARIRSPRMHDANQGIRMRTGGTNLAPLFVWGANQPLYPVDTPIVEIDQTAAASGTISALYSYSNLTGVNPRLATWQDVAPRIRQISGVEVLVSASAAIGSYSPGVALNSTNDNFEAGVDYALLGYLTSSSVSAISVVGQDTGNLRVGGPGPNDPKVTYRWFFEAAYWTGDAWIPIIAANNKGSTLVSQVSNIAAAAQSVTLFLAELG